MCVMDVHVYGVDLMSVNSRSAFAHDTQAPPQAFSTWLTLANTHSHRQTHTFGHSYIHTYTHTHTHTHTHTNTHTHAHRDMYKKE